MSGQCGALLVFDIPQRLVPRHEVRFKEGRK